MLRNYFWQLAARKMEESASEEGLGKNFSNSDSGDSDNLGPDGGECGEIGFDDEDKSQTEHKEMEELQTTSAYEGSKTFEVPTGVDLAAKQQGNDTGYSEYEVKMFKDYKRKRSGLT